MKSTNRTVKSILLNLIMAAISLFFFGVGVYLTILAGIGAGPWDVFTIGLSKTFGVLYGTASIALSCIILIIDMLFREPIGIAMVVDALLVGKAVDFCNWLDLLPVPRTLVGSIIMMLIGLVIMGYTQYFYMKASLGCGPRDTLLVALSRRCKKVPIGVVSIILLAAVTLAGYFLGGPVGIGTLICAFATGPIMQFAFFTVKFDATEIRHQNILETFRVLFPKK